jgi:hypothetical protein
MKELFLNLPKLYLKIKFLLQKAYLLGAEKNTWEPNIVVILFTYQILFFLLLSVTKVSIAYQVIFVIIAINSQLFIKMNRFLFYHKYALAIFLNPKTFYPDFNINAENLLRKFNLLRGSIFAIDVIFIIFLIAGLGPAWLLIILCLVILWDLLPLLFVKVYLEPVYKITSRYFKEHDSDIIVYLSGGVNFEYHLEQWREFLEKLDHRVTIIVREAHFMKYASGMSIPAVRIGDRFRLLSDFFNGTEKIVFYLNNSYTNFQMLSFKGCAHVLLLHGESDKGPSTNYVSRIYNYLFVAGQAAIDRYKSVGIDIPADRFKIIGRPQLESLFKDSGNAERIAGGLKTVLYAPTFYGFRAVDSYSSLEKMGVRLVQNILESGKYRLILKLHPLTMSSYAEDYETAQEIIALLSKYPPELSLWIDPVNPEIDLYGCFLESDLLIIDYMPLNRPIIATNPFGIEISKGEKEFPFWKGSYLLNEADDVVALIDEALERDPKREEREKTARYYLGENIFESDNLMNQSIETVDSIIEEMQRDKKINGIKEPI